jgi:hypothetical protein
MNVAYLAIHSSQPVGPPDDVHKNWRGVFSKKKNKGHLLGFEKDTAQRKSQTALTYKELFSELYKTTERHIHSQLKDIPKKGFFKGPNNKAVEVQLLTALAPLKLTISKHDIISFARACPFFAHGGKSITKGSKNDRFATEKIDGILPIFHQPDSVIPERNDTLKLLHGFGTDTRCLLIASKVKPLTTDDVCYYLPMSQLPSPKFSTKDVILAFAYSKSVHDIYFDYTGCVRVDLMRSVPPSNKIQLCNGFATLLSICREGCIETSTIYSDLDKRVEKLISFIEADLDHVLKHHVDLEKQFLVLKMSVVYQFDIVSDVIPQSEHTSMKISTEHPSTNNILIQARTATQNNTKPVLLYTDDEADNTLHYFRDLSRVLETIRNSLSSTGQVLPDDVLASPKKHHFDPPSHWEKTDLRYNSATTCCLITHKIGNVHSLSKSLMPIGSSLFFSNCSYSEATNTTQSFLHTTFSCPDTKNDLSLSTTRWTSDKLIAAICGIHWKSMNHDGRSIMISWLLFFSILTTRHHPHFLLRYEEYPKLLNLLYSVHEKLKQLAIGPEENILQQNGCLTPTGHKIVEVISDISPSYKALDDLFAKTKIAYTPPLHPFFWDPIQPSMLAASRRRGVMRAYMIEEPPAFRPLPGNEGDDEFETYECTFKFKVPREHGDRHL